MRSSRSNAPAIAIAVVLLAGAVPAQGDVSASIDQLVDAWRATPDRTPDQLTEKLVAIGAAAEPHLCKLLQGELGSSTQPIAMALARIGGPEGTARALGRLLASPEEAHRLIAATALGEVQAKEPLKALLEVLEDPAARVRAAAAGSIAKVAREHPELNVPRWLRSQLPRLEPRDRAKALLLTITAEARELRADAAARVVIRKLIEEWRATGARSTAALTERFVEIGPMAERVFVQLLGSPSEADVAAPIALAIVRIGPSPQSLDAITDLQSSKNDRQRIASVLALGEIKDRLGAGRLIAFLDDPAKAVRVAAAQSLAKVCGANPDYDVLAWHASELRNLQQRDQLAVFLGELDIAESRRMLIGFLEVFQDTETKLAGLHGLSLCARSDDVAAAVLGALKQDDTVVRRRACLVLGKMKARPAIRPLIDCLREDHKGLVANAHWALKKITGLGLAAEPKLWELWWDRAGSKQVPRPAPR